jgi:hypothetical protein
VGKSFFKVLRPGPERVFLLPFLIPIQRLVQTKQSHSQPPSVQRFAAALPLSQFPSVGTRSALWSEGAVTGQGQEYISGVGMLEGNIT